VPIDTSARRFRANVLANLLYFVFNAGLQLWFTRYLIDHLGVATYGLVPLATNMTNYMAILTVALSGSVGRFLTIDLARGDVETANKTFNTSLFATIVLAIALLPVVGALSWFSPHILNIPEGEENGTRFLLVCTGFAFLLNTVGSNFACSTFAKNRFDYQRAVDVVGQAVQVGVAVTLFSVLGAKLWQVGIGIAAMSVMRQAGYQITWRKLTPELRIRPRSFDRTRLREVLGMGGWLTVDAASTIALTGLDLLLANVLLGSEAAGLYAPCLQLTIMARTVVGVFTSVLAPTYAAALGAGNRPRVARLAGEGMWTISWVIALLVGVLAGSAPLVLRIWLGPSYTSMWPLVLALVLPQTVTMCVSPLSPVFLAANRLAVPCMVNLALAPAAIALTWVLVGAAGLGPVGIALGTAGLLAARHVAFTPWYVARVLGQPSRPFYRALAGVAVGTAVVGGCTVVIMQCLSGLGLACTVLALAALSVLYLLTVWGLVLRDGDRCRLRSLSTGA